MKDIKLTSLLFGIFVSLYALPTLAQETYHHFAGNIENGGKIYANLLIADSSVAGYLEAPDLFEKPLYCSGTLNEGNLEIATDADSPIIYKGKYDYAGSIMGELHENRAIYNVQMDESCNEGCMPFKVHSIHSVKLLGSASGSPVAVFNATLLEAFSTEGSHLNKLIQKRFFKISEPIPSKAVLPAAENVFFNQYVQRNASLNTAENYSRLNWEQSRIMRIVYNRNQRVSLAMHDYAYTGGSYGLKITRFLVYDMINEREIRLNDLITTDGLPKLHQLIGLNLKQDFGVPKDEPLNNHGFYSADIEVSENFYLIENGLVFHYNPYEIASDKGETDVLVTWEQLKGILKKEVL